MKTTANRNKLLLMSILTTMAAIGVHIYLTIHFYGIKYGTAEGPSFCNINEVMNCDAVTASKFSAFLGVPIALWGVVTNLVLLYFIFVTRSRLTQDTAKTSRYTFLISLITVVASVVMGLISFTAIGNLCIFCIAAYIFSIIGFVGIWLTTEDLNASNIKEDIKDIFVTERWVAGFLIAIPAFAFLGNFMYLESSGLAQLEKVAAEKVAYWQVSPEVKFDMNQGLVLQKGTGEAKMVIVEFADFRCPHCKHAAPTLHSFVNTHPDAKLIFKPFPLDASCNDVIPRGDGISCGLAASVICAEKMAKKGWAAHDYLFEHQEEIINTQNLDKNMEGLSQGLGLNLEELKSCIKDAATMDSVRSMAKEGATAQIQGTPSVFVNGRLLNGGQLIPVLEAAYKTLKQ
ncbi:vitamin K epoxide reductase/DsbA family protein [Bdellovibrio reynosensis]|uniref:Thioredoxin domain-containing protein n=1 Tax=Bdellovibrio reynosensis TaxID=2835041 RepID=A0ABY4CAD0_9BACT|nr:vitamin K epoxide reductase family protein [Bdellovibrio reynosensis]UOF01928.1 thioredoxin domain-containing protein [Bdellovibrio reynosensis]